MSFSSSPPQTPRWVTASAIPLRSVATRPSSGRPAAAGTVYLFDLTTGQELLKLTASDAADLDVFGYSVAISGNTAIVGAINDDARHGAAYLFDVSTGEELFKLTASDPGTGNLANNLFGHSVAISGNTAIVAAPRGIDGPAYVFDVTTGQELFKLTDSDPAVFDQFAQSVAIGGNVALVGAVGNDGVCTNDPSCNSGLAWLFDVTTGQRLLKFTASDAASSDLFGWSVALNDKTALVGAIGGNSGTGSAYLFSVVPEPATLRAAGSWPAAVRLAQVTPQNRKKNPMRNTGRPF